MMNRKNFLRRATQMGMLFGCSFLGFKNRGTAINYYQASENDEQNRDQKFKEDWIKSFLDNLEDQFDEKTRIKFMEKCGQACAQSHAVDRVKSCNGSIDKLLTVLSRILGDQNVIRDENTVYLQYTRCYCPLVAKGSQRLSKTYCYCSLGWIKEIFETALDKPIEAEIIQTVKRGDSTCKFIVRL
jgi:predicted ArsR family transcriptional regulator